VPTTTRGYRYPAGSAAPNAPLDLSNLASDVDTDVAAVEAALGPAYATYAPTFYSNLTSGTTIAGGSVSVTYCRYRTVGKQIHYYGHAVINTTTASGFGVSLPVSTSARQFALDCWLRGTSGYTTSFGGGHTPPISAPFNRFGPVNNANAQLNIANSGDTVHWNFVYESA
jgi:hypothetical protein